MRAAPAFGCGGRIQLQPRASKPRSAALTSPSFLCRPLGWHPFCQPGAPVLWQPGRLEQRKRPGGHLRLRLRRRDAHRGSTTPPGRRRWAPCTGPCAQPTSCPESTRGLHPAQRWACGPAAPGSRQPGPGWRCNGTGGVQHCGPSAHPCRPSTSQACSPLPYRAPRSQIACFIGAPLPDAPPHLPGGPPPSPPLQGQSREDLPRPSLRGLCLWLRRLPLTPQAGGQRAVSRHRLACSRTVLRHCPLPHRP